MVVASPSPPHTDPFLSRGLAARHGDLSSYAYGIYGHQIEPYQLAWEEALNSLDRVVIVCPPDTRKSTSVQYWIERAIGQNPNIRILWLMNSGTQSEKRVMTVGQTLTSNPFYRRAFPSVIPDPEGQWTKSALYIKRQISSPDPTLMGVGWDGPYQGFHFDRIILDDLTDQKDVFSPTTMEMQRLKLRGVILDRLAENGRIVAIMTRWGENDLLPTFIELGFTVIEMPVVGDYPWGPTLSNRKFPIESIPKLRRDKTDALFNLTYMCNAQAMQGGIIRRDSIRYWDKDNLPSDATLTLMAVDPAASTRTWADPSCIGIGLLAPMTRKTYITDLWTGRVEIQDLEKEILKRAQRTAGLVAIGLETVGFQLTLMQRLRREYKLPVRELPYRTRRQAMNKAIGLDKDKMGRAIYVESKFLANKLFLSRDLPMSSGVSVETELCSFPHGKHDDRLDVISFICALADAYSMPRIKVSIRGF